MISSWWSNFQSCRKWRWRLKSRSIRLQWLDFRCLIRSQNLWKWQTVGRTQILPVGLQLGPFLYSFHDLSSYYQMNVSQAGDFYQDHYKLTWPSFFDKGPKETRPKLRSSVNKSLDDIWWHRTWSGKHSPVNQNTTGPANSVNNKLSKAHSQESNK